MSSCFIAFHRFNTAVAFSVSCSEGGVNVAWRAVPFLGRAFVLGRARARCSRLRRPPSLPTLDGAESERSSAPAASEADAIASPSPFLSSSSSSSANASSSTRRRRLGAVDGMVLHPSGTVNFGHAGQLGTAPALGGFTFNPLSASAAFTPLPCAAAARDDARRRNTAVAAVVRSVRRLQSAVPILRCRGGCAVDEGCVCRVALKLGFEVFFPIFFGFFGFWNVSLLVFGFSTFNTSRFYGRPLALLRTVLLLSKQLALCSVAPFCTLPMLSLTPSRAVLRNRAPGASLHRAVRRLRGVARGTPAQQVAELALQSVNALSLSLMLALSLSLFRIHHRLERGRVEPGVQWRRVNLKCTF
jgi:hypothetical protein